jgi:hypothetical protein
MIPRLPFDQITQPDPLRAFAAFLGEHGQLLVETVRDLLFELFGRP